MGFNRTVFLAFIGMTLVAIAVGTIGWLSSVDMVASFDQVVDGETPYGSTVQRLRHQTAIGAEVQKSLSDTSLSVAERRYLHYRAKDHLNTVAALFQAGDALVAAYPAGLSQSGDHGELRGNWLEAKSAVNRWSAGVDTALALYDEWEATAIFAPDALMARILHMRGDFYLTVAELNALVFSGDDTDFDAPGTEEECAFGHWLAEFRGGGCDGAGNAVFQEVAEAVSVPHREFHQRARDLIEQVRSGHGDTQARLKILDSVVSAAHAVIGRIDDLTAEAKRAKTLYENARRYSTTILPDSFADASRHIENLVATYQSELDAATAAHAAAARRTALSRWLAAATILLAAGLAASLGWTMRSRRTTPPPGGTGPHSKTPTLQNEAAGRFLPGSSRLLRLDAAGTEPAPASPASAPTAPDPAPCGTAERILAAAPSRPSARSPRKFPPVRKRPRPPMRPRHGKWL
ncbi:MAG: CZB domain-containing protein [Planctomycetes bacterium]|nr:CZB domain-containing protein [Planctomycetota bacterium]